MKDLNYRCQTSALSCPDNQVSVNGVCINRVVPGQMCQDTAQCFDGAECTTNTRFCVCARGMNLISGFCRRLSSDDPCDQATMVRYFWQKFKNYILGLKIREAILKTFTFLLEITLRRYIKHKIHTPIFQPPVYGLF